MESTSSGAREIFDALKSPDALSPAALLKWTEQISKEKAISLERNDQEEAKIYWISGSIASAHIIFQDVFVKLKRGEYYKAWCALEQCELVIEALEKHYVSPAVDPHGLLYIKEMVSRWQELFPYAVFFSPELLKRTVVCSTCGATVKPRSQCGHKKGEIYNGEICTHMVTKCDVISISIVDDPVQKYSVAFLSSKENGEPVDHYDYSNLKFIIDRLESPYHKWEHEVTQRIIKRGDANHLDLGSKCPCLSGKCFGECCASKDELLIPHLQITFHVTSAASLPAEELLF